MTNLPLTVLSQNSLKVTVGWTPPVGVAGYVFSRDGKRVSSTFDPSKSQVSFGIPDDQPHTFTVTALGEVAEGQVAVNGPPPPQPGVWWAGPQPPDTSIPPVPSGALRVTTASDLKTLCATGGRGGAYLAAAFTYTGNLDIGNYAGLSLWLDPSFKIVGPAGSANAAVSVHGNGLNLYGGDVSNPDGGANGSGGDGIKIAGSGSPVGVRWWGVKVHDIAAQGISAQCNGQTITADLDADVSGWGLKYKTLDPHTYEKGTGLHGLYLGGSASGKFTGRVVAYCHDGGVGAAWSSGSHMRDTEVWLSCKNLNGVTPDRFSGNGFQQWGGDNANITVKNLLVDGATLATFFESLSSGPVTIEHGRYRNIKLSPAFQTSSHVTFKDWQKA